MENIVCEVNKESPNPGSDALHARIGSQDLDQARLVNADETVRYLMKSITTPWPKRRLSQMRRARKFAAW